MDRGAWPLQSRGSLSRTRLSAACQQTPEHSLGTGSPHLLTLGRSGHQPPWPPTLPPPRSLQVDSCISSPPLLVLASPTPQINQRPSLKTLELYRMCPAGKGEGVLLGGGPADQTRETKGLLALPRKGACGLFRPSRPVTDPRLAKRGWGN